VATVVGNVLVPGPDTRSGLPFFHSDAPARRQSALHAADNIVLDEGGHARPGEVPEGMLAEERRVWVAPLDVLPTGGVLDVVLAEAGALPGRRDAHDRRIIEEVRTRGGRVIDSPAEVATD
jgi:hypothetical protein